MTPYSRWKIILFTNEHNIIFRRLVIFSKFRILVKGVANNMFETGFSYKIIYTI